MRNWNDIPSRDGALTRVKVSRGGVALEFLAGLAAGAIWLEVLRRLRKRDFKYKRVMMVIAVACLVISFISAVYLAVHQLKI